MFLKLLRLLSQPAKKWKNSRGQGIIETQLVTIIFFTVTFFGVIDMARIIILELKAFTASYMACRIAIVSGSGAAQLAVASPTSPFMFNPLRIPYTKMETENPPGQNYDNGMRRVTVRFFYTQKIMFPGLLQPALDMAKRSNKTLDRFVVLSGLPGGANIIDFIGPNTMLNGYYYTWNSGGSVLPHPMLGAIPAGFEWMKMMGYPGNGPYTF